MAPWHHVPLVSLAEFREIQHWFSIQTYFLEKILKPSSTEFPRALFGQGNAETGSLRLDPSQECGTIWNLVSTYNHLLGTSRFKKNLNSLIQVRALTRQLRPKKTTAWKRFAWVRSHHVSTSRKKHANINHEFTVKQNRW